jgi:hypothetical protein
VKGFLNGFQALLARLFFFRSLLFLDQGIDMRFERSEGVNQARIKLIVDDAHAGAGCEIQERHIHQAPEVASEPRRMLQAGQCREILDYPGPGPGQGNARGLIRFTQIQLRVSVTETGPDRR